MTNESRTPQNDELTYTAMRAAFVTTLDGLLRYALEPDSVFDRPLGFMSCFPMLNGMAPQIQLECLFQTWERIQTGTIESSDVLDELVVYAAYESLVQFSDEKHPASLRVVLNGPRPVADEPDQWLHSKARCLQIAGPNPAQPHFLRELCQIQDPSSRQENENDSRRCESRDELLELVGRWVSRKDILLGSRGLLTQDEQDILRAFFEEHPGLVR